MATFTNFAIVRRDLCGQLSEPSTDSDEALQEDVTLALNLVNSFLDAVWNIFPLVCIDETIPTLDCLGYHPRGEWSGVFNPREQAVNINAQRVDDMVASAAIPDGVNFRIFQFLFAHTFLHEAIFCMEPRLVVLLNRKHLGEHWNTTVISVSVHQPGIPHLLGTDQMAYRISQTYIDNFVVSRIMEFPYTLEGEPQNANNFQSMGAGTIVENFMPGPYMMSHSLTQGHQVRLDDIQRVLHDPHVRDLV
ncbi:hypothetical protein ACJ73_09944 [Blastomyces percursus]|uniref:Uncharacterized protein n=1 Tax=Blastomyces percursus TaxID=1658174 RepID=A0A1J9Q2C4_9EURO|nr:hypothetical protein ACJ73_09944 [Blastomyces percursus]